MTRIAVLVSGQGRGSNMQSIIDGCAAGEINGEVSLVLGVNDDAPAMERARSQGIVTVAVSPRDFGSDEDYDQALFKTLKAHKIDLICLAGYMRVLGSELVKEWNGRIMNVHPALIPSFCGKGMYGHHVHEAVIERGVKVTGATVHFVDEIYDNGPIILQTCVPVEDDDTADSVAARVLKTEHKAYVEAISLFCDNRLRIEGRRVRILPGV